MSTEHNDQGLHNNISYVLMRDVLEMGFENESCVSSLGCGGLPGYLESRFEMQTVR